MSHGHELVESADPCALPDGLRACAAEFVGGMTATSSAASSANADEHDPAAQTLTESARVSASVCAITAAAPRIASMPPPHCLPTDAIGGGGGRAVGAVDDLSMGGAEISYSAHHAQDMSANGKLRHHHDAHKPTRRSAKNQERRRHANGVAYMMNSARNEQQRQMGLQPSLDIKGLNDTQADNEGLGAGGECKKMVNLSGVERFCVCRCSALGREEGTSHSSRGPRIGAPHAARGRRCLGGCLARANHHESDSCEYASCVSIIGRAPRVWLSIKSHGPIRRAPVVLCVACGARRP